MFVVPQLVNKIRQTCLVLKMPDWLDFLARELRANLGGGGGAIFASPALVTSLTTSLIYWRMMDKRLGEC